MEGTSSAAPAQGSAGLHDAAKHYEELGFTFCKIGTICLLALAPRYALLAAAALTIFFYVRALQQGVTRSDCILRHPLVIISFWLCVAAADIVWLAVSSGELIRKT